MEILFLGGVFDDSHNKEIISKTKTYVEYAANNFQKKIINGLKECNANIRVISAPFLGAYPKAYSDIYFKGFSDNKNDQSGYEYVHFLNIWGIRNFSRKKALKKAIRNFAECDGDDKLIIVYTPHTPLIQAANYAKSIDKNIKICLVVPDLPQYMNLADNVSKVYKMLKKFDVKTFMRENKGVDTYIVLTEAMIDKLEVEKRPYDVVEGIYQKADTWGNKSEKSVQKTIVYTGKLDKSFGIMNLIQAFSMIDNPNIRLLICGNGEEASNVERAAEKDKRITYKGQVASEEARKFIIDGDILVNPRQNNSEYTKYSFPSKIIDYLATGNAVIAYKLDGMPDIYKEFITFIEDDKIETLRDTLIQVLNMNNAQTQLMAEKAKVYLENELSEKAVAKKILQLNFSKETIEL